MALACLVILAVLQVLVLQAALGARRWSREQAYRHQARWLAEAGIERAAAHLAANRNYRGETWQVPAQELPAAGQEPGEPGNVEIEVQPAPVDGVESTPAAATQIVRVRAAYPAELPRRVIYEKQIIISPSRAR
jgi:hypothetical protein